MGEYIEKEATIKRIEAVYCVGCNSYNGVRCRACGTGDAIDMIEDAPAADVAPVVHGRWSDAGFGELPKHAPYGWACSACGGISFNNEYIYCPNCGAKMDGGDGDAKSV